MVERSYVPGNGEIVGRPAHRMGRLWEFRKEESDEWVRSGGADESRGARHE